MAGRRGRKRAEQPAKQEQTATVQPAPDLTADKVRTFIKEANRQQKNASEYTGHVGSLTKQFCEKTGMGRKAATTVRTLENMEPAKRLAHYRDLFRLAMLAGHFDQIDAFDDMTVHFEQFVSRAKARTATPEPSASTLDDVLEGARTVN